MVVIYKVDGPKEKTYTTKRTVKYATVSYLTNQGRKRTRNFRLDKNGHIMAKSMNGAARVKRNGDIEKARELVDNHATTKESKREYNHQRKEARKMMRKHNKRLERNREQQSLENTEY